MIRMRTFAKLLLLAGYCLLVAHAKSIDDVDKEEVVLGEDDDAPALTDAEQELVAQDEQVQVDAKTGVRLYRGYRVVRTMPKTQAHLEALRFVSNGECALSNDKINSNIVFFSSTVHRHFLTFADHIVWMIYTYV